MLDNIIFQINRLRERLWVKPLIFCIISIVAVFLAKLTDATSLGEIVPKIDSESIETLLTTISASMLVISTFAVASMISAYSAASSTATPRSFSLVVADDVSQNALSAFIGAFIFSIVALVALKNSYYDKAGNFTLFVLLLSVFMIVILTFLRWVDRIARLGRLGTTIDRVEEAAQTALKKRKILPALGGVPVAFITNNGFPVFSKTVGYVQRINMEELQLFAEENNLVIDIVSVPGTFSSADKPLAFLSSQITDVSKIIEAFVIGKTRVYDDDPRFGLIALSEIASRALSPAVNDPGTAISIIGSLVRLFTFWEEPLEKDEKEKIKFDRVKVPELSVKDMFDDAFRPIARDGAGSVEVGIRLQKAFVTLETIGRTETKLVAKSHAKAAFERAKKSLEFEDDVKSIREVALLSI